MSKIFEFLFELEFRGSCVTERTEHAQAESAEQRKSGRERERESECLREFMQRVLLVCLLTHQGGSCFIKRNESNNGGRTKKKKTPSRV